MKTKLGLLAVTLLYFTGCANQDFLGKKILQMGSQGGGPGGGPGATPTPVPTPTPPPPNAKVFFKNPNYVAKAAIGYNISFGSSYIVTPSTPINFDTYLSPVNITGMQNNRLENADIKVLTTLQSSAVVPRAIPDASGNWMYSSIGDNSHQLGQLMAYYWINSEKLKAESILKNSWHPTGKNVSVYSYCYDANGGGNGYNAYWAGQYSNYTCMSYLTPIETAYDASVYLHEMGHANIDYATNGSMGSIGSSTTQCGNNYCCSSADGCGPAINEGQADVHSHMVFDSGVIGEFFLNNMNGISGRAAEKNTNLTASGMYNGTAINPNNNQPYGSIGKEIHYMGGVWGAAWWTLRTQIPIDDAMKIFLAHLELLSGNDTFKSALTAILTADTTLVRNGVFTADHRQQILAAFAQHGITP